jgi:thioredoxin
MTVKELSSDSEFNKYIGSSQLTVVDFYATWCGPCKAIAPSFDSLSTRYKQVQFGRCDVDRMQSVSQRYGITGMPTFKFFRSGKEVGEVVGADLAGIENKLRSLAGGSSAAAAGTSSAGYVLGSGKRVGPGLGNTMASTYQNPHMLVIIGLALFLVYTWLTKPSMPDLDL